MMNEIQLNILTVIRVQQALHMGVKANVGTEITPQQAEALLWYIDRLESKASLGFPKSEKCQESEE